MSTQQTVLDIAMNLTRMGNWAADGYQSKQKRIATFLQQTHVYVASLEIDTRDTSFRRTFQSFLKDFHELEKEAENIPIDERLWAEKMMTWGNILTHRAKLLSP